MGAEAAYWRHRNFWRLTLFTGKSKQQERASQNALRKPNKTPLSRYVRRFAIWQLSAPVFDLPGNLLFSQHSPVLNRAQPNFDHFFSKRRRCRKKSVSAATFEFSNLLDTFPIMAKLVSLRDGKPKHFDCSLRPLSGRVASASAVLRHIEFD